MIKKLNDRTRLMSEISYKLSNAINYTYARLLSDSYQLLNCLTNVIMQN